MEFRGTTICAVKRNGVTAIAGDGQVTMGESVIMKGNAVKVKRIYNGKVVIGFAGSVSDAFALSEKFEEMLNKYSGSLMRSAVEYAKNIRNGHRGNSEALMIVADKNTLLILTSMGDVIEPDDGILAIGSGGNFALAAGRALKMHAGEHLSAKQIAEAALNTAADICVFTNHNLTIEEV